MSTPRLITKTTLQFCAVMLVLVVAKPLQGQDPLRNSSRECAICHFRWVDAFERTDSRDNAMQEVLERRAGSGDMCLSCHDGSVVDSRFKVWSTQHHNTEAVPSAAVTIPTDKFPLDAQGRMTCATCHTAHAVSDSSDLKTVVFLRQPNIDSSLCLSCHPEHAQKNDFQHPLGRRDAPVPQVILDAGGKTSEDGHEIFCQTCHAPHGAGNDWMLVLPTSKLCIACHTERAPDAHPADGAPIHRIGQSYPGFEPPKTLLDEKATFGANGELDCLSCHRLHDASGAIPLLIRKNDSGSLCLECHKKEKTVIQSPHDLRISSPDTVNAIGETPEVSGPCGVCHRIHGWARDVPETDINRSSGCMECHKDGGPGSLNRPYIEAHPVGVPVTEPAEISLPLDMPSRNIGCLTCHNPHTPRATDDAAEGKIQTPRSFLRQEGSQLCIICHDKITDSLTGPHDPNSFTPAVRQATGKYFSIGACRTCHTTHNAKGPNLRASVPDTISDDRLFADPCQTCHSMDDVERPKHTNHPLDVAHPKQKLHPDDTLPQDSDPAFGCAGCHDPHAGADSPGLLRLPIEDLCIDCHKDKQGIQNSKHDPAVSQWAKELGFVSAGPCIDCHPIHEPVNESGIWKLIPIKEGSQQLCDSCHRTEAPGKQVKTSHLGKVFTADTNSPFDKPVISSDRQVMCATCHDIHNNQQSLELLRGSRQDSKVCITCHTDASALIGSAHDLRTSAPDAQNMRGETSDESGPCGSCHLEHQPSGGQKRTISKRDFGKSYCTRCHNKGQNAVTKRIPKNIEHPSVALINRIEPALPGYMPTFNVRGEPLYTGAISCMTCHDPHVTGSSPEAAEGSTLSHSKFLRPTGSKSLCADCHGIESLWRFLYYHQDHNDRF